jgi:hypothetical protein
MKCNYGVGLDGESDSVTLVDLIESGIHVQEASLSPRHSVEPFRALVARSSGRALLI